MKKISSDMFETDKFNNNFFYIGNDLGITYTKDSTRFKVWAPLAENMTLMLYNNGDIDIPCVSNEYPMFRDIKGTWSVNIKGDLEGSFYTFKVKNPDLEEKEAGDPYAVAVGVNGDRSAVIDLSKTNPENWLSDRKPPLNNRTDSIIYELHIRDLSTHKASGIKNVGKFLQFTENTQAGENGITRGINHLVELGVTSVHLLPSFDYSTIDEKTLFKNEFNWGYDPKNYNVPEGSYSTNPYNPSVRILEFKQMVKALHENGIRVIMDVVYNHTVDNITSKFHILVPGYYYRMNSDGTFCDGSYCGSETASERLMMRKYIVDSVKYWANEYHIDGFRFDLMGLHDIDTMNMVRTELDRIDPTILVYGEGWDMGNLPREIRAIQPHVHRLPRIGMFNDNVRDNLKGAWSDTTKHGFIDGKQNLELEIMKCVTGSIFYNEIVKDYNCTPEQSINYVEAHDNNTLWDKLQIANPKASEETLIKMDMLANAIVLTSQGIPFISAGEEFLRTKNGDENSFKSPDSVNMLDWERKAHYKKVFDYFKGLILLRRKHSAFRIATEQLIKQHISFLDTPRNTIAFIIKNHAGGDSWKNILVAYNANNAVKQLKIPMGNWTAVVKDSYAGLTDLEAFSGSSINISPISAVVMYTDNELTISDLFHQKHVALSAVNTNRLKLNGKTFIMDDNIIQESDTIYIPLVSIAKSIDFKVIADDRNYVIQLKNNKQLHILNNQLILDNEVLTSNDKIKQTSNSLLISAELAEKLLDIKVLVNYQAYDCEDIKCDVETPEIYILYKCY